MIKLACIKIILNSYKKIFHKNIKQNFKIKMNKL